MTTRQNEHKRWSSWTVEIKVWKILAALVLLPILVLWFNIVHQDDEILALVRNEVVTGDAGARTWTGSFANTNSRTLRDVAVIVDLVDSQNRTVGKAEARAAELVSAMRVDLQTPLPPDAARMRVYSVQWRMDRSTADKWLRRASASALMGPFRESWEFGYLMVDPNKVGG
ncbi:MAG: FxLYD domain-containing protein [Gammaproteobacteria bacterium]